MLTWELGWLSSPSWSTSSGAVAVDGAWKLEVVPPLCLMWGVSHLNPSISALKVTPSAPEPLGSCRLFRYLVKPVLIVLYRLVQSSSGVESSLATYIDNNIFEIVFQNRISNCKTRSIIICRSTAISLTSVLSLPTLELKLGPYDTRISTKWPHKPQTEI